MHASGGPWLAYRERVAGCSQSLWQRSADPVGGEANGYTLVTAGTTHAATRIPWRSMWEAR